MPPATTDATDVDLATAATKTLDGRHMNKGEFFFEIASNPIAEQGAEKRIATGENAAADSGEPAAVTFKPASIGYSLRDLKAALPIRPPTAMSMLAPPRTAGRSTRSATPRAS